jgi:ATP/maltotriose-dependent transcriptional regulator MalT
VAWASPIVGDVDGALRGASVSLEQLRGQAEPFWTAAAVATAGSLETAVGRYDDALRHVREARDLAERFDSAWLTGWSQVQLGTLAVMRVRFDEARALLDEGLSLSLAAHSTPLVTLCLSAFARLAFAEGNPERAALLAGAADGLRQRAGVRAWPMLRQPEAELLAQVRQALGSDRFDQVFAAGSRLSQQEAVTAVRDPHSAGAQTF